MADKNFNIVKALEEKDYVGIETEVKARIDAKFKNRVNETIMKLKEKKT